MSELKIIKKISDDLYNILDAYIPYLSEEDIKNAIKNAYKKGRESVLKDIEKLSKDKGEWYKYYIKIKDLKEKIKEQTK